MAEKLSVVKKKAEAAMAPPTLKDAGVNQARVDEMRRLMRAGTRNTTMLAGGLEQSATAGRKTLLGM